MIGLLTGLGLGEGVAKAIAYFVLPVLLVVGTVLALDAWGDSRFRAGEAKREAVWKAAGDALILKAAYAENAATTNEIPRVAAYAEQLEDEKEKIDAATENGASPVDALFPAAAGNSVR